MTSSRTTLSPEALFAGPGEIRALCRSIDWASTPLGAVTDWPQGLRMAAKLCLDARFPMSVWAGPELVLLYNAGYPPVLGPAKHPWAMGRPAREVWAELWENLGPELERVVQHGESTYHEEARFILNRKGRAEETFFNYSFTPIPDQDGRIVGALNVFVETTEQVLALKQRTDLLRAISDSSRDVLFAKDRQSRLLFANPATLALIGKSADQVLGKTDLEFLEDKQAAHEVMANDRKVLESGERLELEERVPLADGTERLWHSVKTPYRDAAGEVVGLLGISRDITDRKRDEVALLQSQARLERERARLQAIVDTIPVGLLIFESDGKVALTNEEAKRIWAGAAPPAEVTPEVQERGFWPQSGERLRPEEWPSAQALLHGESTQGLVVEIERLDGTRGTALFSGAPIRDERGQATGAVVAIQDISALRDAQAKLEEADRRKNQFLAILSHELRNPLTPVKNSLHILRHTEPGGAQALRAQDVIERQIDQLAHLVDDLLDVTRITRGKIQLQRRRIELNELVKRTLEDQRTLFDRGGLGIELELAPKPVFIHADWNRVAQVLGNLLQNAARFTARGGQVRVGVSTDAALRQAVVRVQDSGAGIAPEMLGKLFEPFVQADSTLDRSRGGLGLGLALVRGLVEQHGGTVEAQSAGLGKGSQFTVRFPLDVEAISAAPPAQESPHPRRRRVLIIEDNLDAAQSLQEVLSLIGHEVEVAYDGSEGIAKARAFHPEVVLCDIGLPGMDGYAVARAMRADEALRQVHLVALTGYALPEDSKRALAAGFDQHLAKPPNLERLDGLLGSLSA